MYGTLPKNERSFDFDAVGSTTGFAYKGAFTVRCVLNLGQKHTVELEKSRLTADQRNPSQTLLGLAVALAELRGRIVEAPAWWKDSKGGADILDEEVIYDLLNKCLDLEEQWKTDVRKAGEEAASKNAQTVTQ